MPWWPCILWCISYLGPCGTKANLRFSRKLQCIELVFSWRCIGTHNCLGIAQSISKTVMDSTDQSPSSPGSNCDDATSNTIELQCMDIGWDNFQLLYLPLQKEVVAEVQLCSVSSTWQRGCFYDCLTILFIGFGKQESKLVGKWWWTLSTRSLPNCKRRNRWWLPRKVVIGFVPLKAFITIPLVCSIWKM